MLGRLEMDVQSAISAYLTLSESIFKPRRKAFNVVSRLSDAMKAHARFDAARLEQCIRAIVKERLLSSVEYLCRIFFIPPQSSSLKCGVSYRTSGSDAGLLG